MVPSDCNMPDSIDGFLAYGHAGADLGGGILPPAIFEKVFEAYNFSISSTLFDSNKLYAISRDGQYRDTCIGDTFVSVSIKHVFVHRRYK